MYVWNTTEGGPCVLRPIPPNCPDSPVWDDPEITLSSECQSSINKETGEPTLKVSSGDQKLFKLFMYKYLVGPVSQAIARTIFWDNLRILNQSEVSNGL